MIKKLLIALAASGGLALAAPAAQALAMPLPAVGLVAHAATVAPPAVLPAPAGLRATVAPHRAVLRWNAVSGANDYELRITGPSRFDRVVPDGARHAGVTVVLAPGRYSAIVRAGRSARDVHGHWSAARGFTVPGLPPAYSSAASHALAWALTQAGKWYVWGGAGPAAYDCSGLAMVAYEHAGISLPHNTVMMLDSGHLHWIASTSARPGDLVMWGGSSPYHVELFVKAGETFGAHQSGERISFAPIWGAPAFYRVS